MCHNLRDGGRRPAETLHVDNTWHVAALRADTGIFLGFGKWGV